MKQGYLIAICAASGFALTMGISLWRSRDSGEELARAQPSPRAAAVRPPQAFVRPPPPAASLAVTAAPLMPPPPAAAVSVERAPQNMAATDLMTSDAPQRPEWQARRLARRAAERDSH